MIWMILVFLKSFFIISMMISWYIEPFILKSLELVPVIALLGPRQVGKTTLAHNLAQKIRDKKPVEYLDLENEIVLAKLNQKQLFLSGFQNKLVIIDEIQRVPELFPGHVELDWWTQAGGRERWPFFHPRFCVARSFASIIRKLGRANSLYRLKTSLYSRGSAGHRRTLWYKQAVVSGRVPGKLVGAKRWWKLELAWQFYLDVCRTGYSVVGPTSPFWKIEKFLVHVGLSARYATQSG